MYGIIARYYDSEHADKDDDLLLYDALAQEIGDPVAIVGAGTGRIALHLGGAGHRVHAVEIEPRMIERARARLRAMPGIADRVTLHEGDARHLSLPQPARLVIIPYNTLMHFLTVADQRALLSNLRLWLADGGTLVIDLPNPGDAYATPDTEALTLERTFLDLETGLPVMQQSVSRLDRAEGLMHITWIYDRLGEDGMIARTVAPSVIRYFFLNELRLLLTLCGFHHVEAFGDFDQSPYEDGSPRLIVLAR